MGYYRGTLGVIAPPPPDATGGLEYGTGGGGGSTSPATSSGSGSTTTAPAPTEGGGQVLTFQPLVEPTQTQPTGGGGGDQGQEISPTFVTYGPIEPTDQGGAGGGGAPSPAPATSSATVPIALGVGLLLAVLAARMKRAKE